MFIIFHVNILAIPKLKWMTIFNYFFINCSFNELSSIVSCNVQFLAKIINQFSCC